MQKLHYFLLCLFCFCLVACQSSGGDKVRLNLRTEPPTLDPRKTNDTTSSAVIQMLFDGLTRMVNDQKEPQMSVAESVDISKDLKQYTFHLRPCLWSNKDPVTAYDFEYSWKKVLNPAFVSDYAYQLYIIKNAREAKEGRVSLSDVGVRALDEKTLQVDLVHPVPYFLELVAFPTFFPVNKRIDQKNPNWSDDMGSDFCSNGPFILKKWKHQGEIVVVKNPNYWDRDSVKLKGILLTMVGDENTELNMFENNELDWAGAPLSYLPNDSVATLKKRDEFNTYPIAATYWYVFNTEKKPFQNTKMRRAFSLAVNRRAIVDNITQTGQIPATGPVPPTFKSKERPQNYFDDHNVELAKALFQEGLEEMGLQKQELGMIKISYNNAEGHQKIAEAIAQQWKQSLGVEVELENLEWKVYLDNLSKRNFQIGRFGWVADFDDPINFLEIFKYRNYGNNHSGWENAQFVSLLDRSSTEKDVKKRLDLLRQAEEVLVGEMPIMPIYYYTNSYLKNQRVDGVYLSGLGRIDFKWASLR